MRKLGRAKVYAGKAICWGAVGMLCVAATIGTFGLMLAGYGQDLSR